MHKPCLYLYFQRETPKEKVEQLNDNNKIKKKKKQKKGLIVKELAITNKV